MTSTVIHSARLVTAGVETADAWVRFEGAQVAAIGSGDGWEPAERVVDATDAAGPGAVLTPGFLDLHGHGGAGHAYDDGPDDVRAARALHRAHGTTRAVVSLVTAPPPLLARRAAMVAELTRTDADILGSHLEGPFLAPARRGAHEAALLTPPTAHLLDAFLAAGDDTIVQVTLAPELPGGLDAVRRLVSAGVAVAVGHTEAGWDEASAAFDAGASLVTHAFNAMPGLGHRAPGPLGAALARDGVTIEAIADGVHVHPALIRVLMDAAPRRVALITDAMAAAGSGDGRFLLGALDVDVSDGVARLAGDGTIAGSTLTQDAALRTAVAAGVSLPAAVEALTGAPARAIARDDLGALAPGRLADAVLLDARLTVRGVWTAGANLDLTA